MNCMDGLENAPNCMPLRATTVDGCGCVGAHTPAEVARYVGGHSRRNLGGHGHRHDSWDVHCGDRVHCCVHRHDGPGRRVHRCDHHHGGWYSFCCHLSHAGHCRSQHFHAHCCLDCDLGDHHSRDDGPDRALSQCAAHGYDHARAPGPYLEYCGRDCCRMTSSKKHPRLHPVLLCHAGLQHLQKTGGRQC